MADNQISSSYDGLHMPYSPEAEQALLGAIILESDVFDKVIEYIKSPDYFYVSLHKLIFKTMTESTSAAKSTLSHCLKNLSRQVRLTKRQARHIFMTL